MANLSYTDHQQYNGVRPIGAAQDLASMRFWDVGTGNCNSMIDANGVHFLYFDFGGNGTGASSKNYPNPVPNFPSTGGTTHVLVSHWDNDHCNGVKKTPAFGNLTWLGTREDIAPRTKKDINARCTNLFLVPLGQADYKFVTTAGLEIEIVRCQGNHKVGGKKRKDRNDMGIALFVRKLSAAGLAVELMHIFAAANPNNMAGTAAAGGAIGADLYKNLVIQAAHNSVGGAANASAVVAAARAALAAPVVEIAARAVVAAQEFAVANPNNGAGTAAAARAIVGPDLAAHAYPRALAQAGEVQALVSPGNSAQVVATLVAALQPNPVTSPAALAVVAMVNHALTNGAPTHLTTLAAAGAHNDNPYILQVLEAARAFSAANGGAAPLLVAKAGLAGLSNPPRTSNAVLLTGDACYQAIPNCRAHPWDLLLAYHHGTYLCFTQGNNSSDPPLPAYSGHSRIVYSSGKRGNTKVHGHPNPKAINKYRQFGWDNELYTAAIGGARGDKDYVVP